MRTLYRRGRPLNVMQVILTPPPQPRRGRILGTPIVAMLCPHMHPGDPVEVVETRPDGSHVVRLNGALWRLNAASVEVLE